MAVSITCELPESKDSAPATELITPRSWAGRSESLFTGRMHPLTTCSPEYNVVAPHVVCPSRVAVSLVANTRGVLLIGGVTALLVGSLGRPGSLKLRE